MFTPGDFRDLGGRSAVDLALMRHYRSGTIRRLARGLYDYPRTDSALGVLAPPANAVARALAGRDSIRLQPSGSYAANLLGLSNQVPMRVVFLTDGPSRRVRIGKQEILLKHTTPRNMATAGKVSGLVIQALRHLGRQHVDELVVRHLRNRLDEKAKSQLVRDLKYAPAWIASVIRQVIEPQGT